MNSLKSILTCAAVAAVALNGIADTTPTAPYDKLVLTQADAFSNTTVTPVSGALSDTTPAATLAQTDVALKDVEKFDVTFKPTFCDDASALPTPTGAKVGFAFVNETTAAYFNGSAWQTETMTSEVSEGTQYAVHFDIDRRATPMARIKLDGTTLVDWFAVSDLAANAIAIYGTGTIVSMAGTTYTISAEVIEIIPEGEETAIDIKLTPAQVKAIGDPASATKLANGHTALTSYILFGKASTAITASDKPQVVGVPKASAADKVALKIQGLNVQAIEGVTVQYKLMGSTTGADDSWNEVVAPQDSTAFEFSASTNYRFFKVVTVITYATK